MKPNQNSKPSKRLLIKLGTLCNLNCPHCHQVQKSFKEHPRLLEWIKEEGFNRITFSGGEPLMYFDIIKRYMEYLGQDVHYRMMSKGTLLTKEIAEFFNKFEKVSYSVSYDGKCGGRDLEVPIQWGNLKHFNRGFGLCTIFSKPDFSYREFAKDVKNVFETNDLKHSVDHEFFKINWIHQTKDAPNEDFTQEVADEYIKQTTRQLDHALYCYSIGELDETIVLNLFGRWYDKPKFHHGTKCCNEKLVCVNLDGTMMRCPYGGKEEIIGTIDNPPSDEIYDSFIPERCKTCEHWEICRCECVASVTALDCYVNRTMIPIVRDLIKKYELNEKIDELFRNPNPRFRSGRLRKVK